MNQKQHKLYKEQQQEINTSLSQLATIIRTIDGLQSFFASPIKASLQEQQSMWKNISPSPDRNIHSPPIIDLLLS